MSKEVEPSAVMKFLNDLFGSFDDLIEEYKVQKVGQTFIIVRECTSSSTHLHRLRLLGTATLLLQGSSTRVLMAFMKSYHLMIHE